MDIRLYEDWMKPQVAKLFSMQYGVKEADFAKLIGNFYEHPFQKNRCIRIVATDGDKVIGFQSFFYWPYTYKGKTFNSYQSGNSLVHADYRNKGIFQKLLNYLNEQPELFKIDFLVGFPIKASIGSLLRNKWVNIFNLQWYIKLINPLSIFHSIQEDVLNIIFPNQNIIINNEGDKNIRLANSKDFSAWRNTHYENEKYYSFLFIEEGNQVLFKLKLNIRKKIIRELIIGDVITTSYESKFLENALTDFLKEIKKVKCVTLISIALNEKSNNALLASLLKQKFKKINKQIYFCVKPFSNTDVINLVDKWIVYRGDIDTW